MKPELKELSRQTIVITGPTSGIGLVTARMAAKRGARVVLAARTGGALRELTNEIRSLGGQAEYAIADVSDRQQVRDVASVAIRKFGGFDTWVTTQAFRSMESSKTFRSKTTGNCSTQITGASCTVR